MMIFIATDVEGLHKDSECATPAEQLDHLRRRPPSIRHGSHAPQRLVWVTGALPSARPKAGGGGDAAGPGEGGMTTSSCLLAEG